MVLRPVNQRQTYALTPEGEDHAFDARDLTLAEDAFRHFRDGLSHPVHPRVLELMYRAVTHFEAPYVHVVSGFRTTRSSSRHSQGRAVDMVLPGVPDRRLARFLQEQGYVGVGVYPTSGFVHLDVRERSHFWVDRSGPGQRSRRRPVQHARARRMDSRARRRGEEAVPDIELAVRDEAQDDLPEVPGG